MADMDYTCSLPKWLKQEEMQDNSCRSAMRPSIRVSSPWRDTHVALYINNERKQRHGVHIECNMEIRKRTMDQCKCTS